MGDAPLWLETFDILLCDLDGGYESTEYARVHGRHQAGANAGARERGDGGCFRSAFCLLFGGRGSFVFVFFFFSPECCERSCCSFL